MAPPWGGFAGNRGRSASPEVKRFPAETRGGADTKERAAEKPKRPSAAIAAQRPQRGWEKLAGRRSEMERRKGGEAERGCMGGTFVVRRLDVGQQDARQRCLPKRQA